MNYTAHLEQTQPAGTVRPSQHCANMSTNSSNASDGVTGPQPTVTDEPFVFKEPVEIHFDGAHSTGRNAAAVGFVLTDATGRVLTRENFEIEYTTSVQTEFKALIHALNTAKDIGIRKLKIFGDCSPVIDLVRGDVDTSKDALATITETARTILTTFDTYDIDHTDRTENELADGLAVTALDNAAQ